VSLPALALDQGRDVRAQRDSPARATPDASSGTASRRSVIVDRIIWLVGAVVIVLFILGYFGFR